MSCRHGQNNNKKLPAKHL